MGICGSTNSKNGPPTSKYSEASSPAPNDEGDHHRPDQSKMSHSASEALNGLDPHLKESVKNRKAQKNKKFKEGMVEDDNTLHEVNIVKIDRSPSKSDLAFLTDNMKNHFFFSNLSPEELENLAKKFFYCSVPADTYVFKQNDAASCFFFIHEGEVIVEIDNSDKRHLTTGQGFGELALLYNAPRSASIKAARESRFWAIDRKAFKKVVEDVTAKQFKENREFLNKVAYFDSMTDSQKDSIASVLLSQQFKKGQVIISEGDQASSYYIIKEGSVECVEKGRFIRALNAGESFGEQALYASGHRTLSVLAQTDCRCLALSREALQEILGAKILQVIQANWSRWALKQDKIFSQLTKLQMEKWIQNATCENLEPGTVIMEKNKPLSKLVIVLNGELQFGNRVYAKGTVFESSYMLGQTNKNLIDSLKVGSTKAEVSVLDLMTFYKVIGGNLAEVLEKNKNSHEMKMLEDNKDFRNTVKNMSLNELIFIKKLGEGQFGHVFLVKGAKSGEYYALKAISLHQITEQSLERHTLQEKEVLEMVNFPFIMKMYRTFKDTNFVYFLLSFVRGMELFDVIRQMDLLSNEDSQFYVGSMILAVEYLHKRKIVYRDIKPENIMIDEKGYLKLIDMGTAKILKSENGIARTFTILGTPHYMAPEILKSKGYGLNVDLWSIGVTLYEFMCGLVPFGEECDDPYQVYQLIISNTTLSFPRYFDANSNKYAKLMMEQLLNRLPEARLGGSYAALKAHKWFDRFDWDSLLDMKLTPPYTPPANKMYSNQEMENIANMRIPVTQEIEKSASKFKKTKKNVVSKIPNWDKDF